MDGLMQERRNSSALAMELCLSCINPSICQGIGLFEFELFEFEFFTHLDAVWWSSSSTGQNSLKKISRILNADIFIEDDAFKR